MSGTCPRACRVVFFTLITLTLAVATSAQTEKILYSFTDTSDGGFPQSRLIPDGKGNFYGTAPGGGYQLLGSCL
jgi:hypothetical protein